MSKHFRSILYLLLWLLTLLPLRILYVLADVLFFTAWYLVGYRKRVVITNLRNAFPDKTELEIVAIARGFYRHLTDFIIESVALINLPRRVLNRRFVYNNYELLSNHYHQGRSIALVSGHCNNWEWITDLPKYLVHHFFVLYQPLQNPFSDRLILRLRSKYGGNMVPMTRIIHRVAEYKRQSQKPFGIWFLADQRPPAGAGIWVDFLHQETAFYEGFARIAQANRMALVYMEIKKTGRGKYETTFSTLAEDSSELSTQAIIALYARRLEQQINEQPSLWLWSHKRWKHKRPQP